MNKLGCNNKREIVFSPVGSSISLDLWGVPFQTLYHPLLLPGATKEAAEKAGMHVLAFSIVPFQPQGLSLALILGESHLTVHTSPEHGYAAIDIFTCGKGRPLVAAEYLISMLKPEQHYINEFQRGIRPESQKRRILKNFDPREIELAQR